MKYYIRTGSEEDLVVPSGAQLVLLFRQRFLAPEDEVRREGSTRWRKLRDIPEYAAMIRSEHAERLQFKWILYGVLVVTLASLLYGMLVS